MSFTNKDNVREYTNRTNSNPNKMQSMNNRNINSSQQYSNSNNGENYSYDMKNQLVCNSPKQGGEIHNNQQNSNIRDHYQYKNDNPRIRHYQNKYPNDRPNYYNQQSNSPTDVIIPDIDQLKDFIREQTEQFKFELAKYEGRKSSSPSPRSNYHQDQQGPQRSQQRTSSGINRSASGMPTSNSLGAIVCSNSNYQPTQSYAPTAMSITDKQSNSYSVKCNYNKTVQSTGKPSNLLNRNLSHDETFSKAPPINKNRVSSPINVQEKSPGNKSQFTSSNTMGGVRQDGKLEINKFNKSVPYSFAPGINQTTSQQNTNNSVNAPSHGNDSRKIANPSQSRSNMSAVVSNGKNAGSNSYDTHKRLNGDLEPAKRVEVRLSDNARHMSNSGNTTDSQEVDYCTPESPVSPCSLRSLQTDDNRVGVPAASRLSTKKSM